MGHDHEWILGQHCGPSGRNRGPMPSRIVEVHPVLTPVVAVSHQFEVLASLRMMRMDYLEVRIASVTMQCS
jgi:hypothetical protein